MPSNDFKATIHKGGFFPQGAESGAYIILQTSSDLENYIEKLMTKFRHDTAQVPKGYWDDFEKQVRAFYSQYNDDFFTSRTLVIALIDQGSGSVRYTLKDFEIKDGRLDIRINRDSPFIQTMDFVSWVLHLELCKSAGDFESVRVELINIGT